MKRMHANGHGIVLMALRIALRLGLPWSLMSVFLLVRRALRDLVYDIVSNLRHRIAGTTDRCDIPSEALRQRMT